MNWLKENWFKVGLLLVLVGITSIVSFYYLSYIPSRDQKKQDKEEMEKTREVEAKKEQEKKDYTAKRRKDCFDIYDKEKANWSNVRGSEYDEGLDTCYVTYKAQSNEWAGKDCKTFKPGEGIEFGSNIWKILQHDYQDCTNGEFRKEF